MLKTISRSSNRKLGGCAATYRSGHRNVFGTCPNSCKLKPSSGTGTSTVDTEYLSVLLSAVPRGGVSWTYTHFGPDSVPLPQPKQTVVNLSADTVEQALDYISQGYPTVVALPADQSSKVDRHQEVRFVRCPAEYNPKVDCNNCGSGVPLCARPDRDYVIKFTAHGNQAKLVGDEREGGCYGSSGPVAIHWYKTRSQTQPLSDAEVLVEWIHSLPYGTKVRHHVVGDLGSE